MNKLTNLKALLLFAFFALFLLHPASLNAQSDGFFRGGNDNNLNRDGEININSNTGNGITNDGFGAPVGSGLLILTAVGTGYAIARRRRNVKKGTTLLLVFALILGMTNCKKNQNEPQNTVVNQVMITLDAGGNGGSKHTINTTTGAVTFQNGDVIYVGDGSTYIGTLTRTDGVFSGPINEPADETEIYFFFVGGLTPSVTPSAGTTSSFTVNISDQSSQMPVLSSNHVTYYTGTSSYSCVLQNHCALVKFTTANTTNPVRVGGLYTKATIDFATPAITPEGTKGFVALNSSSVNEKWAVLLPQTSFDDAEATIAHVGYTVDIPNIEADGFITGENAIEISTPSNIVYLDWLTSDYTATNGQTLTGTLGGNYKISVNANNPTVILRNVTINKNGTYNEAAWAGITCDNNTTLVLIGTNNVTGFYEDYPGIYIAPEKTLTIQAESDGALNASCNGGEYGWGAGIGGAYELDCGNIVINSGTINAIGGRAAGIGGASEGACGNITINGGIVTATGGIGGAGIGAALAHLSSTSCGDITINGGTVMAAGGDFAAGIGSGCAFLKPITACTCGDITITGGTVEATGGAGGDSGIFGIIDKDTGEPYTIAGGAGIGSGSSGPYVASNKNLKGKCNCGAITIESSVTSVTATKGSDAVNCIGMNNITYNNGYCGAVTIGGTVYCNAMPQNSVSYPYDNDGDTYLTDSPLEYPVSEP